MLVYRANKHDFNQDVVLNRIDEKVLNALYYNHIFGIQDSQQRAFRNSLRFMRDIVEDPDISDEVEIAIEYQVPRTSMRVDFMIAGTNDEGKENVVIVELKQWEKAEKVDDIMLHSVKAFTGGANRIVNHPSYQALSYALSIKNYSEFVQDRGIGIWPCAYLHNCNPRDRVPLDDVIYKDWYSEAPLFDKSQVISFRNFVKHYVTKKSSNGELLYDMDRNGKIRPSKALQDCLASLMEGNKEFILLEDQAVAYDMCCKLMDQCQKDRKKRSIVIQGGPGTGKSVLAINLLYEFVRNKRLNASYCTKNRAPRDVYKKKLSKSNLKAEANIDNLFRSPFGLGKLGQNFFDCLIVDESHRLVERMYGDWGGENQVKECINSSLLTIFFIDEDQRITKSDIGSINEIKKWAKVLNSHIYLKEETILHSQFRCNGSDLFIQFVNNLLQIGEYIDVNVSELGFEFRVFDDPIILRDELRKLNRINNKARMVAGYCYDWDVKHNRGEYDIYLENGFKAKWNLPDDKLWAISSSSFEQVGCIHTAQGLEFDYIGVIIGKDLRFDEKTHTIVTDRTKISRDDNTSGIRTASDDEAKILIKNTYKTLLTRGQKGCFVYCEDKALGEHFKAMLKN